MAVTRYLQRFTSLTDPNDYVEFGRTHYAMRVRQDLRQPSAPVIGSSYAYRLRGNDPPLKGVGVATINYEMYAFDGAELDAKRDELEAKLYNYGTGYLVYTDGLKAEASLQNMPEIEINYEQPHIIPVVLVFDIWTDFS